MSSSFSTILWFSLYIQYTTSSYISMSYQNFIVLSIYNQSYIYSLIHLQPELYIYLFSTKAKINQFLMITFNCLLVQSLNGTFLFKSTIVFLLFDFHVIGVLLAFKVSKCSLLSCFLCKVQLSQMSICLFSNISYLLSIDLSSVLVIYLSVYFLHLLIYPCLCQTQSRIRIRTVPGD